MSDSNIIIDRSHAAAKRERERSPAVIQGGQSVRFPPGIKMRWANVQANGGSTDHVACKFYDKNDNVTNEEVEVYGDIQPPDGTDRLDLVSPPIIQGEDWPVAKYGDYWWFVQMFTDLGVVRHVMATEDATDNNHITCHFVNNYGDEIEEDVEIYADICGGTKLNEAFPRIAEGDFLRAVRFNDEGWWFVQNFQASQECA